LSSIQAYPRDVEMYLWSLKIILYTWKTSLQKFVNLHSIVKSFKSTWKI
jgi:hypothetical protein